uniref:hypothetical protein n=1 Tax=Eubacterium cellulosolvens TaxID=29322 RepID=UPI000B24AD6E|nr:hypothetical protein [[Eubacterium] cellulosolvens]
MRVKYADVVFDVRYECREADRLFERYETDEPADEHVVITEEDLTKTFIMVNDFGFRKNAQWNLLEEDLVFYAAHMKMCPLLLAHDVLVFHGAGVAVDNRGYVFLAPHDTGKTTHVKHWQSCFGDKAELIDDDKLFIKASDDGFYVYGTGWAPYTRPAMVGGVPLACVTGIRRGPENRIGQMDADAAMRLTTRHGYRAKDPMQLLKCISLCDRIVKSVPFASLECINDISAASVAYEYLSRA